ncbi:MAG: hypothetical protein K8H99_06630 [Nitrospirae bacterium]|nr:hypothetical protein [Fimbriimonadaceae bacterium]
MPIELRISIQDDSPVGHAVKRMVATGGVTPEEAAERLMAEGAQLHGEETPAERLIGAFASAEDGDAMDRAVASAKAHRAQFDRVRDLGF